MQNCRLNWIALLPYRWITIAPSFHQLLRDLAILEPGTLNEVANRVLQMLALAVKSESRTAVTRTVRLAAYPIVGENEFLRIDHFRSSVARKF